jgi:eukaryotic-like serine/threonine-protein kinase
MGNIIATIGRYQLDARLGEGASGVVYRAYDPVMDRIVAIKSPRTDTLTPEQIRDVIAEYHHEAKVAGKYAHENIVTIYDVITHEALDHIVMEYVPGRSVHDYMKATGPLDLDEALSITYKCCVALAYIHHHGVIHRDIKPGNIMYHPAQGLVKLMDFSVAHNIEDPPVRDTGTIAYMAPEHFDPKRRISLLTDIFALGATLYRILTGKYPFTNKNTAYQILHEAPVPITDLRRGIPAEVVAIINKAMAKSDADRYQTASEFASALRQTILKLYPDSNLLTSSVNYLTL